MTPEHWQVVKVALHEALLQSGAEREHYLEGLAGRDPPLRAEVEALLAADRPDRRFLETPATALLEAPPPNAYAGRRLGPYRMLEEIAAGGMGQVYRAVREGEYRQEVAIKLVLAGPANRFVSERLRAERQILANLEHPNIARLLDGGTAEDGVPYLVMELIDGQPIDAYCREQRLDRTARLRLFVDVCSAVQYAHRHMVIHRDLKPNNVLVARASGAPKLLDFGIAKILEPESTTPNEPQVLSYLHQLTPGYASPEQLTGRAVTAASDVYSLGVILYELLTHASYGQKNEAALARLPPDLRAILRMALAEAPENRYATVEQFGQDIRRHLDHQPVLAREPTVLYLGSLFIRRHRTSVAAAALIVVALVGALSLTLREAQIARRAYARADEESRAANEVTRYLQTLFSAASPQRTGGQPINARTLIDAGQRQIDAEFASRPELRARMLGAIGGLYCEIGQSSLCRADLERALALETGRPDQDPLVVARLQMRLAGAYTDAGRTDAALALLQQAQPIFEHQSSATRDLATLWYTRGQALRASGQPEQAVAALLQAKNLQLGTHSEPAELSATLGALAIAEIEAGHAEEARSVADQHLEIVRRQFGEDDVRYVDALNDYAEVANSAGQFEEAQRSWRRVIDEYMRFFGRASDKSIDAELSLADSLFRRNKLADSIAWFQRSVADYRAQGSLERTEYMGALNGLSQVLWMRGDFREAEAAAHEAYLISQRMPGLAAEEAAKAAFKWAHALAFVGGAREALRLLTPEMPGPRSRIISFVGLRLLWRGDAFRELGDTESALQSYDEAIAFYNSFKRPQSVALSMAYEGKALTLQRAGRSGEAVPLLRQAIAGYAASQYVRDGPTLAGARMELAENLFRSGQLGEARSILATTASRVREQLAPVHPARLALARIETPLTRDGPGAGRADDSRTLAADED